MLNEILWNIYFTIFEIRYTTWLGNSCRPYLEATPVSCYWEMALSESSLIAFLLQAQTIYRTDGVATG